MTKLSATIRKMLTGLTILGKKMMFWRKKAPAPKFLRIRKAKPGETVLEVKGITKRFPGVVANDHIDFKIKAGEIHGLLGENGAGKSTLMNIIYGLYKADKGEIFINGEKVTISSPVDAIEHKIGMIHQHITLVPEFTVLENIVLGMKREKGLLGLGLKEERNKVLELSKKFGLEIPLDAKVKELPIGVQQKVEILRTLYRGAEILILDEPTTSLVPHEVDKLFTSLRVMVRKGLTIVFITHRIREALKVCDRITVLKLGKVRGILEMKGATPKKLVEMMVGKEIEISKSIMFAKLTKKRISPVRRSKKPILVVRNLKVLEKKVPVVRDCSFEIYKGEIFGLAGVTGNGQKQLLDTMIGLRKADKGDILINGKNIRDLSTFDILNLGCVYIPGDRIKEGILPLVTVAENLILGCHKDKQFCKKRFFLSWLDLKSLSGTSKELISGYSIKTPNEKALAATLSGGNIQRIMIARAFSRPASVLIADNPTRGLDALSTEFVLKKLIECKSKGIAVLLLSENLDELLKLCDRMGAIYRGEIVDTFERKNFNKYKIGLAMTGGRG